MQYTLIHLSDLHYRSGWQEENDLVSDRLLKDIASEIKGNSNVFAAFTGDLVFAADDPQGYRDFLQKIGNGLDAAGIPPARRFSIPGNHDVSREKLHKQLTLHNGALSAITTESSFNDNLALLAEHYFDSKFARYRACESEFATLGCCGQHVGGIGWDLADGLGVYCLNTALTSCAALTDADGRKISDKGRLAIDTRRLHQWLARSDARTRVLLAHHPLDWLQEWARTELERTIADSFHLVLTGHVHSVDSFAAARSVRQTVFCAAPALFTRKNETLGYTILNVAPANGAITVRYRQWVDNHRRFVAGSALAGNDTGVLTYAQGEDRNEVPMPNTPISVNVQTAETLSLLRAELDEALLNYSSKPLVWVERDIATLPETHPNRASAALLTPTQLAETIRNCVIRAPGEFGLTCVGKKIALEYHRLSPAKDICLYIDGSQIQAHRRAVETHIAERLEQLHAREKKISGVIVDGWARDANGKKLVKSLREQLGDVPIVLLERIDVGRDIANIFDPKPFEHGELLYLWALTQNRIRELVQCYLEDICSLDPTKVTHKIIKDIDTLNIFRTPQNCLMFLRLAEHAFDDSPVNRTELIHRVLFLLFYKFDQIPTYASRPDLKDCEYVLGFLCEWLLRESRASFSKHEFYTKGTAYCQEQFISVDIEVLFSFLLAARIIVYHGNAFEFRFAYWLNYFAAHRMHHDTEFAQFILSERRYAVIPEIIEFYTGIDRRRVDAVRVICKDLEALASTVSERTQIDPAFDPFAHAKWKPSKDDIKTLKEEIANSVVQSSLPAAVKDAIADERYDRSRPYSQEIAQFVDHAALRQMFTATRGAARALRNSDHVPPPDKLALLNAIMTSWKRVSQVIALISPVLAEHSQATYGGINWVVVGDRFAETKDTIERWLLVMNALPANILNWFEDDLFSSKLGPLIYRYLHDHQGTLAEMLLLMVSIRHRPEGWAREVRRFILGTSQDSFGLLQIFLELRGQRDYGFISDAVREQLNHLSATSLAKHSLGSDEPNRDAIRQAAKALGDPLPPTSAELRHSRGPERSRDRKK